VINNSLTQNHAPHQNMHPIGAFGGALIDSCTKGDTKSLGILLARLLLGREYPFPDLKENP